MPTPQPTLDPLSPSPAAVLAPLHPNSVRHLESRFNRWKPWVAIWATKEGRDANVAIADARRRHADRCRRLLAAGASWPYIRGQQRSQWAREADRRDSRELDDPRISDGEFDDIVAVIARGGNVNGKKGKGALAAAARRRIQNEETAKRRRTHAHRT